MLVHCDEILHFNSSIANKSEIRDMILSLLLMSKVQHNCSHNVLYIFNDLKTLNKFLIVYASEVHDRVHKN